MALACLREGYPLDIPENLRDIPLSSTAFFFFPRIFVQISLGLGYTETCRWHQMSLETFLCFPLANRKKGKERVPMSNKKNVSNDIWCLHTLQCNQALTLLARTFWTYVHTYFWSWQENPTKKIINSHLWSCFNNNSLNHFLAPNIIHFKFRLVRISYLKILSFATYSCVKYGTLIFS